MRHLESKLQQTCVKWFRLQYPMCLLFAIPNGGKRSVLEAKIMKGEGVVSGIPDLFLAEPILHETWDGDELLLPGLFIEMKTEKGRLTESQKAIHAKLEQLGYRVAICRSLEEFMQTVNNYLNGK